MAVTTISPVDAARPVTRIAPTPSGFLHEGNCVNFLRVQALAREVGATLVLRIDDMDRERYRREYVDDIFRTLAWLGIDPDQGPSSTTQFEAEFSLQSRQEVYREALSFAMQAGLDGYACACSRRMVASGVSCTCRDRGVRLSAGSSAIRVRLPIDRRDSRLPETGSQPDRAGDVVLWRREDVAAYHLASLIEDRDLGTTHIVRGRDLIESTMVQRALAPYFGATQFEAATFVHHDLLVGPDGAKLSKSTLGRGPLPHTDGLRRRLMEAASS